MLMAARLKELVLQVSRAYRTASCSLGRNFSLPADEFYTCVGSDIILGYSCIGNYLDV